MKPLVSRESIIACVPVQSVIFQFFDE
jgi:hypothetical protein